MKLSRCGCGGVDVHAHVVPEHFPNLPGLSALPGWPSTAIAPEQAGLCHRHVMISGKQYRTISEKCWSTPRRLADLPDMGLSHQVISPMPELLSYWLEASHAQVLVRYLNEQTAAMVAESSGALSGLAAVPLQDIDLAIAELRHVTQALGLVGVELGSNVNGVPIGDPRFLPFFEACEALDVPVFVHALRPTGMDRLVGPAPLQQVLAYPTDVGLAAASVITSNLMLACPQLRMAFSHGGGTLAMLLPRLQQGWQVFPALRDQVQQAPIEQARRLFFDTLVFDEPTLKHLLSTFGTDSLMVGTDYPFNFHDRTPVERINALGLSDADASALLRGNAERFLGRRFTHRGDKT
jgi:aminocarboxymuconate-semialdehyde decarboxylase